VEVIVPVLGMGTAFSVEFACLWVFRKFQWRDRAALGKFPSYIRKVCEFRSGPPPD